MEGLTVAIEDILVPAQAIQPPKKGFGKLDEGSRRQQAVRASLQQRTNKPHSNLLPLQEWISKGRESGPAEQTLADVLFGNRRYLEGASSVNCRLK